MKKRDIQHEILTKLLKAKSLRYKDARPKDVENDLYNYHLQFLVQKGYVEKVEDKYSLSKAGKKYVFDTNPINPEGDKADLFKICVMDIVCEIVDGKIKVLNQKRTREPFYGKKGILGGPIKKSEFVLDAANRNLNLETGLSADFRLLGCVRNPIKHKEDGSLFSDALYYFVLAVSSSGEMTDTEFGENYWAGLDEVIADEESSPSTIPFMIDVLKNLQNYIDGKEPLFYKEEVTWI